MSGATTNADGSAMADMAAVLSGNAREPGSAGALPVVVQFVHEHWLRICAISAAVLLPCFWRHEIEADDLGSHLYNAWLVQLIHRGKLPGLWIVHPWTNVLFDYMLSGFGAVFGLRAGEKIAVALAVLVFFWGAFAMVAAAARRAPWLIAPCIALVTFGWTFEMGFLNYFISLGLAFFGLALFWRGRGWERFALLAIAPVAFLASPLGVIWLAGASAYVWIAERKGRWFHALWFALAAAGIFAAPAILGAFFPLDPATKPFYFFNGADQVLLFGSRYEIVEWALIGFSAVAIAADLLARRGEGRKWVRYAIPTQLYALAILSVWLLPGGVQVSPATTAASLMTERFSAISAVLACCLLGVMRPRKWHLAVTGAIAALFFVFLWQDTGSINEMEAQIVPLVSSLPPGTRVMGSIVSDDRMRVMKQHILDRACIGRCFSYGNYEPGSHDFRVRARPGNAYVLATFDQAAATEDGEYVVQPRDLPLYQIYECSDDGQTLCIAALHAGEKNGAAANR